MSSERFESSHPDHSTVSYRRLPLKNQRLASEGPANPRRFRLTFAPDSPTCLPRLAALLVAALLPIQALAQVNRLARDPIAPDYCTGSDSGTYLPEAVASQNVAQLISRKAMWIRVKDVVTVTGAADYVPTAPDVAQFYLSLPIPTRLGNFFDLSGVMSMRAGAGSSVIGVPDMNMARFFFDGAEAAGTLRYTYTYTLTECS